MKRNVLEYLEETAGKYPDKTGVTDESGSCTFRELMEKSRRTGSALAARIERREPVGVFMEKGISALQAFFGTAYAGGFYVLFNPEFPETRLGQIQSVLDASVIITDEEHYDAACKIFEGRKIYKIEELRKAPDDEAHLAYIRQVTLDTDPLYGNFTSGSTGVPKGVVVSHRSVLDFIDHFTEIFGIGETDVIGNQAPFDFDVSVKDIYSAMKTGAELTVIPKRLFSNPSALLDFICDHKITTLIWAVSALCLVSSFHGLDYKTPETVNKVLFSGEVMPMKHLRAWMEHLPEALFVNLYGPTEITCNCTYHVIDRNRLYEKGIPLGKAFPNEEVFLLSSGGRRIRESGEAGEICVRGTALALGYYNAPEQTAGSFVQNPGNSHFPELIYRTGDLGILDEAGELYFSGRKDFQIKYMGHRIELEEIERAVNQIEGVERCCCIFDEKKNRLYGFYVGTPDKKELHGMLRQVLPVFMIPGTLKKADWLPMTANGKIDRKALRRLTGG